MEDLTRTNPTREGPDHESGDAVRFAPGMVLAGRYRIVGRLGQGGMGDVFRADDLKLGTSVALKFLPEGLAQDPERLSRLHQEVRTARAIAHSNICRVYDIVEADGQQFIAMEYIDGEDLASLLRRIGRLSGDKTLEIMRQLCMGVAAAHEAGVLHRDLKPANIMIDGRGRVRITDFGLAGLASQFAGRELRAGTPAYMAPEQFEQGEVSVQSDLYALGLVLYEMVTGKRTFSGNSIEDYRRLHKLESPTSPSSFAHEVDPAVERVILQCLEKQPGQRPRSAIAVAAALPGADPLAAALAAGETPSPELVAAAGASRGIRPGLAVAALVWCIVSLLAFIVVVAPFRLYHHVPLTQHTFVLGSKAREHLATLAAPTAPAVDHAEGYDHYAGYLRHVEDNDRDPDRWNHLEDGRPALVTYWYRQSPRPLTPANRNQRVSFSDPARDTPGTAAIRVDLLGRLLYFHAVPDTLITEEDVAGETTWEDFFDAAGLNLDDFTATEPVWTPPSHCDARAAWKGAYPEQPDYPIQIEAGTFRGRAVYFAIIEPWRWPPATQPDEPPQAGARTAETVVQTTFLGLFGIALLTALGLAWRNMKLGRGDQRGATRLAVYLIVVQILLWLLTGQHTLRMEEFVAASNAASYALLFAVAMWLAYVAIEPYVRRRWPTTLISWTRLLSGKVSDPLVARDFLMGSAFGLVWTWIFLVPHLDSELLQFSSDRAIEGQLQNLFGLRYWVGTLLELQLQPIFFSMLFLVLIFVLRTAIQFGLQLVRPHAAGQYEWPAVVIFITLLSGMNIAQNWQEQAWFSMVGSTFIYITMFWILLRFGILTLIVANFVVGLMLTYPLTPHVQAWYGGATIFAVSMMLTILCLATWRALDGQPLLKPDLLEH